MRNRGGQKIGLLKTLYGAKIASRFEINFD